MDRNADRISANAMTTARNTERNDMGRTPGGNGLKCRLEISPLVLDGTMATLSGVQTISINPCKPKGHLSKIRNESSFL